jgi:Acetylornithine deacetylase/Succinyl-diaminopimelate desuccinylase and related deacylases
LIERMAASGVQPDLCLVGEPTSVARLGDMVKIGRRGSVNMWIEVEGREGHVAYPHLADNPLPRLVALLAELDALVLDEGTEWFQPSNLEITDITVGNHATNVIPAKASARISIRASGVQPDLCLVGEPTSVARLGDMVKIGRRGSVNMWIEVEGREGHVAYPHLADNPLPRLVALLAELDALVLDEGTEWFQPSNLEITDIAVGNKATNVIPAKASARISIRFNALHTGAALAERVTQIAQRHGAGVRAVISGEAFLTQPGAFSDLLRDAIQAETGLDTELSTTGGTSDARFLKNVCPVIEFGLCNATMHKRDEAAAIDDLEALARIYERAARGALAG